MYTVYILFSRQYNKTYVGYTSNLGERFLSHNELAKNGWTVKFRPWQIIHQEEFEKKELAIDKERYFKSGVGREWIKANLTANLG